MVISEGGKLDATIVEMLGLDIGEAVIAALVEADDVDIHCGVLDFSIVNGIFETNQLIVETSDTTIVGAGKIDLVNEKVLMELEPHAKDVSFL